MFTASWACNSYFVLSIFIYISSIILNNPTNFRICINIVYVVNLALNNFDLRGQANVVTLYLFIRFEGNPPAIPCMKPMKQCKPNPCGPNTDCVVVNNIQRCTCKPGHRESINTIQGCVPIEEPVLALCDPGPCGENANCQITDIGEDCQCAPGYGGNPYKVEFYSFSSTKKLQITCSLICVVFTICALPICFSNEFHLYLKDIHTIQVIKSSNIVHTVTVFRAVLRPTRAPRPPVVPTPSARKTGPVRSSAPAGQFKDDI